MSTLRSALSDYISMRRGLGYKFIQPEQRLGRFIAFMEQRRARVVTGELALEWAMQPHGPAGYMVTSPVGCTRICALPS